MLKIGITGVHGLIGSHLRVYLHQHNDISVIGADRVVFQCGSKLDAFVQSVDVIIHLAGMNRGDENVVYETNINITKKLIESLTRTNSTPHLIFSSSTQINNDSFYARSKKECSRLLQEWSVSSDSNFTNMIIPHVFGEWGKPFYNTVTATFCYQVANDIQTTIQKNIELELIHCQDLASKIFESVKNKVYGNVYVQGKKITVSELRDKINEISKAYFDKPCFQLDDKFDSDLLNTFQYYLFPDKYPIAIEKKQFEIVESKLARIHKQAFNSSSNLIRLIKVSGSGKVIIRKLFDNSNITEFSLNSNECQYIDIPTFHEFEVLETGGQKLEYFVCAINPNFCSD